MPGAGCPHDCGVGERAEGGGVEAERWAQAQGTGGAQGAAWAQGKRDADQIDLSQNALGGPKRPKASDEFSMRTHNY